MRTIDGKLYLTFQEMLECGFKEESIKKAKLRESSGWDFIKDPADARAVLAGYEALKPAYKKRVRERYGDPYAYAAAQPLRDMAAPDPAARSHYLALRLDDGRPLPLEHVRRYTRQAEWLNALAAAEAARPALKRGLGLSFEQFCARAVEMAALEGVRLPESYRRLMDKLADYRRGGYDALVSGKFGNLCAAKVDCAVSAAALLELLAAPNQHDDPTVWMAYNAWAAKNGKQPISLQAVGDWRRRNHSRIILQREGNAAAVGLFVRQVKRYRPTAPLLMVESDDNVLDFLFTDPTDTTAHRDYHRYRAIVVADAYNGYILGWAAAEKLTTDLVRAAWADAMRHIHELTGGWHLPHQVTTDRWALKELQPFYESMGRYVRPALGSKGRGYIEQLFGTAHFKRCQKLGAVNYTGNNITARKRGVNTEALALARKARPLTGGEAYAQMARFFELTRTLPLPGGGTRRQQWLAGWEATPPARRRPISLEQYLLTCGVRHQPGNGREGIRITNRGVEPMIGGVRYSYDLDGVALLDYIGRRVEVYYDPLDMNRVLLTDGGAVRVMASAAVLQPAALADAGEGSRLRLNAIFEEKRQAVDRMAGAAAQRREALGGIVLDPDGLLAAGVLDKPLRQAADDAAVRLLAGGAPGPDEEEDFNPFEQM